MGIGSEVFGLLAAIVVLAVNLGLPLLALLAAPLHMFFRWIYRTDPVAMKAYLAYMKQPDHYDPWTHEGARQMRPKGFGQGLHL